MIALDIQPYCQNCPDFEAEVTHECWEGCGIEQHKYVITCRKKKRCEEIEKYLRQQGGA